MTLPPSGIYMIKNIANGKVYIGQSQNVYERRKQHFYELDKGVHPNEHLQKDYKKYGRLAFTWSFVEQCSLAQLNDKEKSWIEKNNSMWPKGYNLEWKPYKRKTKQMKRKVKGYHRTR